jgi:serine/threonine protein kinase
MQASEIVRSLKLDEIIRAEGSTCLADFAETLEKSPDASVETFLGSRPNTDRSQLPALIAIELRHRWERRCPCFIESYFQRFPELLKHREQVLDLIYAEYCERRQQQDTFESEEYYDRFPDFQDSLERLFQIDSLFEGAHEVIEQATGKSHKLPDAGDEFLDFRLLAELGRGAFGRVFLAEQTSLSDRRVVVKITPQRTIEHQTLARLDHPNIVPVHSVHRDELSELQAVCMPYQGAVALSDVHTTWRETGLVPTSAEVFVHALQNLVPAELRKAEEPYADSRFPVQQSYVVACGWIMHKLAAALHHAHLRGVYHRDLKPSNILLTATGQPLLVDFNLAFNQEETGGDSRAFFGGTLPYMPPEQIQVLHPAEQGRADDVGPRSDIYSLAATVFELLTGRLPFKAPASGDERLMALRGQLELRYAGVPSARSFNPHVPQDFDAMLVKCLDPASYHRYETAAQLADDLDRFLRDRPLKCVGPIPARQVILKFVRRNRRRLGMVAAIITVGLALTGLASVAQKSRVRAAQERKDREQAEIVLDETTKDAIEEAEADLADVTSANQIYRRGFEYFAARKYRQAIVAFTKSIQKGSDFDAQAYYYRGTCHAVFDEDQAAIDDYSRAIEHKPEYGYAYLNRAMTYASTQFNSIKDPKRALDDIARALEFKVPDTDSGAATFFYSAAKVYDYIYRAHIEKPIEGIVQTPEELLDAAQVHLFKAVKLGLSPENVRAMNRRNRFKPLDPLLARREVQEFLERHEKKNEQSSP